MAGKVGRPKNGAKNEAKNEVETHEIMSEKMFSDGKGNKVFVSVSVAFVHTTDDTKPELRFQLKVEKIGASGKESFDVPVSAIPILQQSFVGIIARERNKFLAETDRSSEAVRIRLSRFSDRGMGGYHGILLIGIPVNVTSKDPEQQDPVSWLDKVLSAILSEVGDTTVVPSLDEVNATVAQSAALN